MSKMSARFVICLFLVLTVLALCGQTEASSTRVYVVEIQGDITTGLAHTVEQGIVRAEQKNADIILFPIDTFGGLVDAALRIRTALLRSKLPTVAFVQDRAWSAGALITLSAEHIVMAPGSSIGAAETRPRDEKYISALRGEFKSTAEMRGRDPVLAEAMVDSDVAVEGVVEQNKLLTLTAAEAVDLGMSDSLTGSREEALAELGYEQTFFVYDEPPLLEQFAMLVTLPAVSIFLIAGGLLGIYLEAITPGFALPGTAGVLMLALFFSGQLITGAAGYGLVVLFIAGLALLAAEVFVIPGFGITGIGGIAAIFASLYLSFESSPQALRIITISLLITLVGAIVLFRMMDKSRAWQRLVLFTSEKKDLGYVAPQDQKELEGKKGVALTMIRPAGTAVVDGERIDVVSEGGYIEKGAPIKVIEVEGRRVIVREMKNEE